MATSTIIAVILAVVILIILSVVTWLLPNCRRKSSQFITGTIKEFLEDMEKEKLVRFTDQQLRIATDNYSFQLGSGGFGVVYKGSFSSGTMIAVKVLHGSSDKRNDQQFMAEVGTIGKRRNHDINLSESQEWFPLWVWKKFDAEEVKDLLVACGIDEKNTESVERMVKVALSCVQYRPESRPKMSIVVQMLESLAEIPKPLNPFQHMIDSTFLTFSIQTSNINTDTSNGSVTDSSIMVIEDSVEGVTPIVTSI
ncbi:non-specific serine/threonine protein kinase [Trifolium repens]|nr:non-specific serine/threonine protein kinase [Trifolium repens]